MDCGSHSSSAKSLSANAGILCVPGDFAGSLWINSAIAMVVEKSSSRSYIVEEVKDEEEDEKEEERRITETWATPCVSNSELNIKGYDYIRNDRHEGRGGGSCFYIKQPLTFLPLDYRQFTAVEESCWLRVVLKDNYSLLVGCVYRPPNASGDYDLRLSQAFHAAVDLNMKYCLIAGDFNLPEVHWFPPSGPAKFENLLEAIDTGMWDQ
ncbi:unnamed protein product, partial [Schistocephalus solidus]|uniref:Endo/exonuclease/phosphatase domain-containing protein n=1 Tax=Schistocephalus solidus TaxID=70667 RepID=A0A183TTI9_SCHSO